MTHIGTPAPEHPTEALLRVGAKTAPQAVASAINHSIFDSHLYPQVRAIGHGAVGQAVKAIAIARGYVAPRGIDLAVIIGFDTVLNEAQEEISVITFQTFNR